MSIPFKNALPAPAMSAPGRQAVTPPDAFRPQRASVQTKMAPPVPLPFHPQRSTPQTPIVQSRPAMAAGQLIIQRSKLTAEQAADKAMEELIASEDRAQAKSAKQKAKATPKKAAPKPRVDQAAAAKKATADLAFAQRELERQQEAERNLETFAGHWHQFESGIDNVAALFGLLAEGFASLSAPHRCFLSSYEKHAGARHLNKFGLSMGITISAELQAKYLAVYKVATTDRVVHLHCLEDGSVSSFGVKPLATERQAGNNSVMPPMYRQRANAFVGDIDGANVNTKVGAFN